MIQETLWLLLPSQRPAMQKLTSCWRPLQTLGSAYFLTLTVLLPPHLPHTDESAILRAGVSMPRSDMLKNLACAGRLPKGSLRQRLSVCTVQNR